MSQQARTPREQPPEENGAMEESEEKLDERTTLATQVELLQEENQRLRQAFAHARRTEYQRAAIGLAILGAIAVAGAVVFPTVRTVLLTLGATGLFAAVMSYYLTPERFVSATVGEYVYATSVVDRESLTSELDLQDTPVYVPTAAAGDESARLFVPEKREYELPPTSELNSLFVITDDAQQRGVALEPIGTALFREGRRAVSGELASDPSTLCDQLADATVEVFELADGVTTDVDPDDGRASVGITGSVYGDVDRVDHPIASTFATGLSVTLGTPVTVETTDETDRAEFLVTCRWEPNAEAE